MVIPCLHVFINFDVVDYIRRYALKGSKGSKKQVSHSEKYFLIHTDNIYIQTDQ